MFKQNNYYINKIRQDTHFNQTYLPTYLPTYLHTYLSTTDINNSNINNNNNNNNYNNNNNNNNNGRNDSWAKQLKGETTHLIRAKRPTNKTRAKRLRAKRPGETTHGRNDPDSTIYIGLGYIYKFEFSFTSLSRLFQLV